MSEEKNENQEQERDNQTVIAKFELEKDIETLKEEIKTKINEIINLSFNSFLKLNEKALVYKLSFKEAQENNKEFLEKLKQEFGEGKTQIWSGVLATIDDIIMEFLKGKIETWLKKNNRTLDEEFNKDFVKKTLEPIKARILESFGKEEMGSYITSLSTGKDGEKYSIYIMYNPSPEIIKQSY